MPLKADMGTIQGEKVLILTPDGRTLVPIYVQTRACLVMATSASNAGNWTSTCSP